MSAKKETHAWFSPGLLQPLDWLEGVQLLSVYLIIAILFFFLPEPGHPH
jgi:hypothetical protein